MFSWFIHLSIQYIRTSSFIKDQYNIHNTYLSIYRICKASFHQFVIMVLDFEKFSIFGQIQLTFSRPACLVVCLVVAEGDRKGRRGRRDVKRQY